jgi:hypothetical protein
MTATIKLRPGQKGTKNLLAKYGDALLCVRYRYDVQSRTRSKTVELIVERNPWTPPSHRFKNDTHVPVRIGYDEKTLREMAKAAQGKWDPKTRVWHIQFGKIKGTELERFIIA